MGPHPMASLVAAPLQSAVRAQALTWAETLEVIRHLGMDENGKAHSLRMQVDRLVEEKVLDPKTGQTRTELRSQPVEISVPLLAVLPMPAIHLEEMNVEMGLDVVQSEERQIGVPNDPTAKGAYATSLSTSMARLVPHDKGLGNMKVSLKIKREIPEGLARLGDSLNETIGLKPVEGGGRVVPGVESLGIDPALVRKLQEEKILTVRDFLVATERTDGRTRLMRKLGVRLEEIYSWREAAIELLASK